MFSSNLYAYLHNTFSQKHLWRATSEIDRLLSKGISNIYLKVTIDTFSKLWFSGFKKFVTRSVLGSSNWGRYWISKLLVATYKLDVIWEQNCEWLSYYFHFERSYEVLKSKRPCILWNKNINFNKNKIKSKMENPTHSFREMNFVLQLI